MELKDDNGPPGTLKAKCRETQESRTLTVALTQPISTEAKGPKHQSKSDARIRNANYGSENKLAAKLIQLQNTDTVLHLEIECGESHEFRDHLPL